MKNSFELMEESNTIQKKMDKTKWVFYYAVGLIVSPLLLMWVSDYFLFAFVIGIIIGVVWSLYQTPMQLKRDRLRAQAHKQYGSDEEEY
jgi:FtsH-binding integral membrane protein